MDLRCLKVGAAHKDCNIKYQDDRVIPVVFHNLSGYDAHFIFEDIASGMPGQVNLLPINKEKYISFTKHIEGSKIKFRFIDSYRFLACSLEKLASYLPEYPNLKLQFPLVTEDQFRLLTTKGILPYDYLDSTDRFDENCLPPIEAFFNKLENKSCSSKMYLRAQQVWDKFDCSNLGMYIDLYMKVDIMLLADVFEQFRHSCEKTYDLDPAHYYTLPGYTWDAMLKYTKQVMELLTDPDMFLFVERGIRGGLSQVCANRRGQANNKYMPTYEPSKPENYLMYFDVNNQYGWAMSQALPYGGFEWVQNADNCKWNVGDDHFEGYILEVDLEYPRSIHDIHSDLPFCPEHINPITGNPPLSASEPTKLMSNLKGKNQYVIHYRNLQQALAHGLILKKIHRVLKFNQSPWLKPYIDLNTNLRKSAKNEFEKNLFKLMNNAVFGKTMENVRKRVNIRLLTEWSGRYGAEALIAKPEFKSCTIFNEHLVAVELRKLKIFLNKPIYVGCTILDLAKTTIYNFHYDYMYRTFGQDCNVLYTDTDSLIYSIDKDPYPIIKRDCLQYFDTSDYPEDNIYGIPRVNKKVLGMMKDENNGIIMTDFIGLRSKLYTVRNLTTEEEQFKMEQRLGADEYVPNEIAAIKSNFGLTKKAKGIKKSVVQNQITFNDYVECLENWKEKTVTQNLIRSKKHVVHSVTQEKIALSPMDDKRYLISGSFKTLPWGHYSLVDGDDDVMDTN